MNKKIIVSIIVAITASSGLYWLYTKNTPTLLANYKFEKKHSKIAFDSASNAHGKMFGNSDQNEGIFSAKKHGDYVKFEANEDMSPSNGFTIEADYYADNLISYSPIFSTGNKNFAFSWALRMDKYGRMALAIGNHHFTSTEVSCKKKITPKEWHHVAAGFNPKTMTAKIKCDSEPTQSIKIKQIIPANDSNYIGRYEAFDIPWSGKIKNIKIWKGFKNSI